MSRTRRMITQLPVVRNVKRTSNYPTNDGLGLSAPTPLSQLDRVAEQTGSEHVWMGRWARTTMTH